MMYTDDLVELIANLDNEAYAISTRADSDDDKTQADKAYHLADNIHTLCEQLDEAVNKFVGGSDE